MSIKVISRNEAVRRVGRSLGLPHNEQTDEISSALIAQALRRAASILAPCARHEIRNSVYNTLQPIVQSGSDLSSLVENVLESLIVYRDLLEMRAAPQDAWTSASVTVRPAAPSFVQREDRSVVVLGMAGDVITPLPEDLIEKVVYRGGLRLLFPTSVELLGPRLEEFGLIKLNERAWLRLPKVESATAYLSGWTTRLAVVQPSAQPEGLLICKPVHQRQIYRDRWHPPDDTDKGVFVARRPQRYGADLWCLVDLQGCAIARILDLFSSGDLVRSCDVAWQVQMALDASRGQAQTYRCRTLGGSTVIDFFSPVPSWVERKLLLIGDRHEGKNCLFSYEMTTAAAEMECRFLTESLWMAKHN